jgi:hypothetical protein
MEALTRLSKYLGIYLVWKEIKERYQLRWSANTNIFEVFKSIMDNKENYSCTVSWLKDTCARLAKSYSNVLIYNIVTRLWSNEVCLSLSLLHSDANNG